MEKDEHKGSLGAKSINDLHGQPPSEKPFEFSSLNNTSGDHNVNNMDFILDIPLGITVELGRTKMLISELLKLGQGAGSELSRVAGETLAIWANDKLIAKGEVIVVNDNYGIRLTEILSPVERVEKLG